jgi:hypothetical protein
VISRYIVIVLAYGAAIYRITQGAFVEAACLAALGTGLVVLRAAPAPSPYRRLAWLCFLVTAVSVGVVLARTPR